MAARSPSRSSIARCRCSGWRSIRPRRRRESAGGDPHRHQRRRQRPAGRPDHALRARQGRLRRLCRRRAPVGLPGRRDAAAGLCARREDRDRARRRADRPHRHGHDRPGRARAVAHRAPDRDLSRKGSGQELRQLVIVQRRLPGWTLVKPDAEEALSSAKATTASPSSSPAATRPRPSRSSIQTQSRSSAPRRGRPDPGYAEAREFDQKTRAALTMYCSSRRGRRSAQGDRGRCRAAERPGAGLRDEPRARAGLDLQRRYRWTLGKSRKLSPRPSPGGRRRKGCRGGRAAPAVFAAQLG